MAKKKKQSISDLIGNVRDDVGRIHANRDIPDIVTFINSPQWLGLPSNEVNPIKLYPVQMLTLKCFYRGSVGNEDLELNEGEIQLIKDLDLNNDERGNVLKKYYSGELFSELQLVWGRRSGKDFLVSIIALYEIMKLLECPGGDPYTLYNLSAANTINVITIANAQEQAKIAFTEMKSKLWNSNYFKDKFIKEGFTKNSIFLLTPRDKENNKLRKERGLPPEAGSVALRVGHSNSDSLLGMGAIVLLLDEVATYKNADKIYQAMVPTVSTYRRHEYEVDDDGEFILDEFDNRKIKKTYYDGKIISISSPRGKEGKFYDLYKKAPTTPTRLMMRLSTWEVTPQTRKELRETFVQMSEGEFNMEFGAEFSGIGVENFFTEEQVNSCFIGHNLENRKLGQLGHVYFAHIDPASTSHNYGLVVLHKEFFMNRETQKADFNIIVDHIKYWHPLNGKPIDVWEVTNYILGLKRRFHLGLLTYDQWASSESILELRKKGIPNKMTRFTQQYKMTIYKELENLINAGKIKIPYHDLLRNEMIELRRKFTTRGFTVLPKSEGDGVKSDDLTDCLAGACYSAIQQNVNQLPVAKAVNTGVIPQSNNRVWIGMQGVQGVGTGKQVADYLNRQSSWGNRHI